MLKELAGKGVPLILLLICLAGHAFCFVRVVYTLFRSKYETMAVLSLLCAPIAFVFGWIKAGELKLKTIMIVWSAVAATSVLSLALEMAAP